jgi:hypothetical protein
MRRPGVFRVSLFPEMARAPIPAVTVFRNDALEEYDFCHIML